MSELKVNSIKGVGASAAAITVNNSDGTCTANLTNKPNRNLIINGAMQVAQRGTSSTTSGYGSVDRFFNEYSGTDEASTQAQVDVASGTTPYTKGFRKALKITNGNQTSGAGAADFINIRHIIEAQDIASSGWNYISSSSFITLSFWVKSSVAQNFYGYVRSLDGTAQNFPFETGSLSADTWTKITKTISGNSNLQFDNDTGGGLQLNFGPFWGTDRTGSVSLNTWAAFSSAARMPDNTSTWYTTNDATFEITGLQLEVGSVATDFEHRSFGQELDRCFRYYQRWNFEADKIGVALLHVSSTQTSYSPWKYFKPLRSSGSDTSFSYSALGDFRLILDGSYDRTPTYIGMSTSRRGKYQSEFVVQWSTAGSNDECASMRSNGSNGWLAWSAEL